MKINIRWQLVLYDILIMACSSALFVLFYAFGMPITLQNVAVSSALYLVCMFVARLAWGLYIQIWRYGGVQCYIKLIFSDVCAFALFFIIETTFPIDSISILHQIAFCSINLIGALFIRLSYRYVYKFANTSTKYGRFLSFLLKLFAGGRFTARTIDFSQKIKIAIIGAGRVGVALAEELFTSESAAYLPICFIDASHEKSGRDIHGIPVFTEDDAIFDKLRANEVQEVVIAISHIEPNDRKDLYDRYAKAGYKIKVYDFPVMQSATGKRHMREFDVEELLFRKPIIMHDEKTNVYYRNKTVLITGGGGSIGSELCRQLAKMQPKKIIVLDIYENGAYDVQQELKIAYGDQLDVCVEIASINNKRAMMRVFAQHKPDYVINAAAHKHVPLMEHNCIEAVENNVFGAKILVELCEEFKAERFMMVSTDKAVNPTNVMGATKRMCEMIVQGASTCGSVKYSTTRFGNVLGSAGSVIPLFKRQIANGGPITLTDKRIIRYFMTIPEASQLVLQSGAIANNGELFVLDMGKPIKILDLAESMIKLSGVKDIQIVETGLRPGEKLYEELLVKTEELDKTENSLIFIERCAPLSQSEVEQKLSVLTSAVATESDSQVRLALKQVVPTYKSPEEVNSNADTSDEMIEEKTNLSAKK